ncbi:MAG TPA: monooxygenase [Rhizobiales bacterium]|nr:monooxygenase [Hyphomicrobiales bacterium]
MIIAVVEFELENPVSLAEATRMFEGSAPKYKEMAGLVRKHYIRSGDGRRVGGIYVWKDRAAADAVYDGEWRAFVTQKYGSPPIIRFYENPVVVENG